MRAVLVDHAEHLVRWERGIEVVANAFGQGLLVAEMFWPASPPDWLPWPHARAKRRALALLAGLVDAQVAERRALPAAAAPTDDLLAMMLDVRDHDGSALTPAELHDQCIVMFQAGHETTATALLWWSWFMASHPEAAHRAAAEVDEVLQGRDPGSEDLPRLAYLSATLKEAMRLRPPIAGMMTRRVVRAFALGGLKLPVGTLLRITPWVIQRDGRWFNEPARFLPERFISPAPAMPRGTWMPFGAGPRVCIGQHLATTEMTLVAAMLLQRCTLHRVPGEPEPQPKLHVTLRPALPLRLQLRRRRARQRPAP